MPNKKIIGIDIDDTAFKRFYDLFKQYEAKVEDMPAAWKKLDDAMNGATADFAKNSASANEALAIGATSAALIVEAIEKASKAQGEFYKTAVKSGGAMDKMAASAKVFSGALAACLELRTWAVLRLTVKPRRAARACLRGCWHHSLIIWCSFLGNPSYRRRPMRSLIRRHTHRFRLWFRYRKRNPKAPP